MIALAITEPEESTDSTSLTLEHQYKHHRQFLWTPSYPKKTLLTPEPENPNYQTFNRVLNINFGGTDEENLPNMIRIVAHMDDVHVPFVGLAFDFGGNILRFGRQGRTEVSCPINSAGGERIIAVTYEHAPTSDGIWSLEVDPVLPFP